MSVHILPHHDPIGQPSTSPEKPAYSDEIQLLRAEKASLQRENADLRRFRHNVGRVLRKEWNANTKLTYLELVTTANNPSTPKITHKNKSAAQIETTARAISHQLHISNKTASNALHQLASSGLLEWQQPETVLHDRNGRALSKQEARQVSPKEIGKDKAYHYEKGNGVLYVPDPPPLLPCIEQTNYDKGQREKATNERARLKQALEIIEKASCPECGTVGELRAVCRGCGSAIESDGIGELHTDHNPAATCEFHTSTTDTNPPPESLVTNLQPPPVGKITQLNTEGENFTHPPLPAPRDDSPAARIEVFLQCAIGADSRLAIQKKEKEPGKYITLPSGTTPDFASMLAGNPRHIYAIRPRLGDGLSWVLFADNDKDSERQGLTREELIGAAAKLRRTNIYTMILWREGEKARVCWFFSHPVSPEKARQVILTHAPEFALLKEWFPAGDGGGAFADCHNTAVSLSFTRLKAGRVVYCPMYAVTSCGVIHSNGWGDGVEAQEAIAYAFEMSRTDARMAEAVSDELIVYQVQPSTVEIEKGGVSVDAVRPDNATRYEEIRAAIAWKCSQLNPVDYGVPEHGHFANPLIRKETVGSLRVDTDDYERLMITDFGNTNRRKIDLFECYIVKEYGGDKKRAIAEACREYRQAHQQGVA